MSGPVESGLTRRQYCAGLASVLGALAVSGCATISPQEERELGGKEAENVERTVGLVRDRPLVEYVEAIGKRLSQATGRTDIPWQWAVADDSEANAFALPGGWVYVTRGLLALTNREDEVAGVLAHEMAHVTQRHAVHRVGAATPLAVLFGVPGGILGMVSPTLGGIVNGAGRVVSGLALAPYTREQEHDADRVGIELAARAGWDPKALADFLATLERADAVAGATSKGSSFFATHPSTPDRVTRIETTARSTSRGPAAPIAGSRAALLGRLEGLVVGNNAANGLFVGRLFLHPDFDVALEMPEGWKTVNTAEAAGAVAPDEDAAVLLQVVGTGDDPVAGAQTDGLSEEQMKGIKRIQNSQLPAAGLTGRARDDTRLALTWLAHKKRIFRVTGVCEAAQWDRYQEALARTAASGRPLRAEDQPRITESRLRIRPARAGDTITQVVARGGSTWSAAQAAVANGVAADGKLDRDWPVKVAVSERYRPTASPTSGTR
jgi:predicted Zn-dependent protease